jgi:chemotaxis protein methyltransferase CheR
MLTISEPEYALMKQYIEEHCGIHLEQGKEYLIETRLSDLVIEQGCSSFNEFHEKARRDSNGKLRDRIVDAMTTNETLWFRDDSAWEYIRDIQIPGLLNAAERGEKVRIWSAAASTGQEVYSLLMLLNEGAAARSKPQLLDRFEFLATDISTSALFLAMSGRYNSISINRGLPDFYLNKYFTKQGNVWLFNENLKKKVTFKKFNLQNSFSLLGKFDFIMCRYVAIYFSDSFKKNLFEKMAGVLNPGGVLLLGATESLRGYTDAFEIETYKNSVINILK